MTSSKPVEPRALRVPLIEERLQVDKTVVNRGGVRVHKRVETHVETVDEPLLQEHVEIERRAVGLPIADGLAPEPRYEGDTLILPIVEEVLVTQKRLMLVEEVRITRVAGTHRQPQQVTLRKEHVVIERLDADSETVAVANPDRGDNIDTSDPSGSLPRSEE